MSAFNVKKLSYMVAASGILALFAAQGCGDSDDSQATPSTAGKSNSTAGAGGKTSSTAGSAGKTETTAGAPGAAGTTPTDDGGAGGAGPSGGGGGLGGEGGEPGGTDCTYTDTTVCYPAACAPTTNQEFLNHCVENGCPAHFDNSTLTKLDQVGTL